MIFQHLIYSSTRVSTFYRFSLTLLNLDQTTLMFKLLMLLFKYFNGYFLVMQTQFKAINVGIKCVIFFPKLAILVLLIM